MNISEADSDLAHNIKWTIYGDFELDVMPRTLDETVALYKRVPSMITKVNAVPVEVHMLPLHKFDSKAKRLASVFCCLQDFLYLYVSVG